MGKCQDLDAYGFPLVGLTPREVAAIVHRDDAKLTARWKRQDTHSWDPLGPAPAPRSLKALAREGIPMGLRATLWLQLSGGAALKSRAPAGYYATIARLSKDAKLGLSSADADMFRSFRNHAVLNSFGAIAAVRRVVLAFGRRNPQLLFSQGLNYIVAFLLAVMGLDNEESAFWVLTALLEQRLHPSTVLKDSRGDNVEQRVFETLAERKFPRLLDVFDRLECSMGQLTGDWCRRLFVTTLPAETAARVWDCLLVEGPKVLFRVGLALLKMNEAPLLTTCHSIQVTRILSWRVGRTYDTNNLIKVAFKSIGSVKTELLQQMRVQQEAAIACELRAHKRRLEDILCASGARSGAGSNPLAAALGHVATPIGVPAKPKRLMTILESPIDYGY